MEIQCDFEEVHTDQSSHQGTLLIKDLSLRYEYHSQSLFTIIHKNGNTFLVRNDDNDIVQNITNKRVISLLLDIANRYPNVPEAILKEDISIKFEENNDKSFYKRISFQSLEISLSIYFNNCIYKKIEDKYFFHNPFFKLV